MELPVSPAGVTHLWVRGGERRLLRRRVGWAVGIGGYVLAVIAGMYVLADDVGLAVQVPLWVVHGALLFLGIRKFGARESSSYAALFIVVVSSMAVAVAGIARDDLTLQQRGETVVATVVGERLDPADGRKSRDSYYTLEHEDGTRVPGPEMRTTSDLYDVGQTVTVIADPEADLRPQTPGQADATGEVLGAAGFALAAVGSVVWMAWRGPRPRGRRARPPGGRACGGSRRRGCGRRCGRIPPTGAATSRCPRGVPRPDARPGRPNRVGGGAARGGGRESRGVALR